MNFTLASILMGIVLGSSPSYADEFSADLGRADISLDNTFSIQQQGHYNQAHIQHNGLQLSGAVFQQGANNHIVAAQTGVNRHYRITQRGHNLAVRIRQH